MRSAIKESVAASSPDRELALSLQSGADFPIKSRWTEEQGYSDVPTCSSLDDKTLDISSPSPTCSIIDRKARSLLVFLLITDTGMGKGMT
jgi:hypothetical protein